MPFITEELWQHLYDRKAGESIMVDVLDFVAPTEQDEALVAAIEQAKEIVAGVRTVRNQKNISPKELLALEVVGSSEGTARP